MQTAFKYDIQPFLSTTALLMAALALLIPADQAQGSELKQARRHLPADIRSGTGYRLPINKAATRAFRLADADGNGYISLQEFVRIFSRDDEPSESANLGIVADEMRAQIAFSIKDYNADNRLSLAEYGVFLGQ